MVCESDRNVIGRSWYGSEFHASVGSANVLGTQFHPEKSHRYGMGVLEAFVKFGT